MVRPLALLSVFLVLLLPVSLVGQAANPPDGSWLWEYAAGVPAGCLEFRAAGGGVVFERTFHDGSGSATPVRESASVLGRRFDPVEATPQGDHWVIAADGSLLLRDVEGHIAAARRVDSCDVASSAGGTVVSRRMIRSPEMDRVALAVDQGDNGCDLIPHSAEMVGMLEAVASFQPAAYTIPPSGPVRLTAVGFETMKRRPATEIPFLLYGMSVYRDCIVARRARWRLPIDIETPAGRLYARLDSSGAMRTYADR